MAERRKTSVTHVGNIAIGGDNPIRIQSMATTDTNDTEASVAQAKRIIDAGGELVRFTTQGKREAENMKNISERLKADGYDTPLVADVHFFDFDSVLIEDFLHLAQRQRGVAVGFRGGVDDQYFHVDFSFVSGIYSVNSAASSAAHRAW